LSSKSEKSALTLPGDKGAGWQQQARLPGARAVHCDMHHTKPERFRRFTGHTLKPAGPEDAGHPLRRA